MLCGYNLSRISSFENTNTPAKMFFKQLLLIFLTLINNLSAQQPSLHSPSFELNQSPSASKKIRITELHNQQSSLVDSSKTSGLTTLPRTPLTTHSIHSTELSSDLNNPAFPSTMTFTSPIIVTVTSISISTFTKSTTLTPSPTTDTVASTVTATSSPTTNTKCCAEPKWLLGLLIAIIILLLLNFGGISFSYHSSRRFRHEMNGPDRCGETIRRIEGRCEQCRQTAMETQRYCRETLEETRKSTLNYSKM